GPITSVSAAALDKNGTGKLILSGSNSFSGHLTAEAGVTELRHNSAASTGSISLGDNDTENLPASLVLGVAGLNIANDITTIRDLGAANNLRSITTSVAGNNTISGTVSLNGGVVFGAAAGGTLTVSGVVQNGADTSDSARRAIRVAGAG